LAQVEAARRAVRLRDTAVRRETSLTEESIFADWKSATETRWFDGLGEGAQEYEALRNRALTWGSLR